MAKNNSEKVVFYDTPQGISLFEQSTDKADFWPLSQYFVTQDTLSNCSIASSVMVLNALGLDAPGSGEKHTEKHRIYTQDTFLTKVKLKKVGPNGLTLDQIGKLLHNVPVKFKIVHATTAGLSDFRKTAIKTIQSGDAFIVINFQRQRIYGEKMGHFSPLAAYDKNTDRFLLMDVARFKYPPAWIKTEDLWSAMNTIDNSSKKTRGFIVISK